MPGKESKAKRLSLSVILGMALIPLAALVAVGVVRPQANADQDSTTTTLAESSTQDSIVVEPVFASEDDLKEACGDDGLDLVEMENEGSISDIQQAALDALRQLCEESGMSLPGPLAPPPVFKTEVITVPSSDSQYYDDDQYEHDEYEDDEHEDHEDDEHEEHEDDEHEEREGGG